MNLLIFFLYFNISTPFTFVSIGEGEDFYYFYASFSFAEWMRNFLLINDLPVIDAKRRTKI